MNEKKKIKALVVTPYFSYEGFEHLWKIRFDPQGGMHILVSKISYGLADNSVEQTVLTMGLPGMPKFWSPYKDVTVYKTRIPIPLFKSSLGGYHGLVKAWGLGTLGWVWKNKKKLDVELVFGHCDGSGTAAFVSAMVSRILNVPLVLYIHSCRGSTQEWTVVTELLTNPFAKKAELKAAEQARVLYAQNERTIAYFKENLPPACGTVIRKNTSLPNENVALLDIAEKREQLKREFHLPNKHLVLFLGRISGEKGCEHIVHLAQHLNPEEYHFVFCGDGPEKKNIIKLAKQLNVIDACTFTGFIKHEIVFSMISLCQVGIVPSSYEELGLVILEMMAMKLPVIAHNLETVRQLIQHDETGVLVDPGDYKAMAEYVKKLTTDTRYHQTLAKNAYEKYVKLENISTLCKKTKEDFDAVLEKNAQGKKGQ